MSSEPVRIRDWLIGQEHLFMGLDRVLSQNRLGHAYLLLGQAGSGRTRAALAFAQQLLCTGVRPPCGECRGCSGTARMTHPDLHFIFPASRDDLARPERLASLLEAYSSDRHHRRLASGSGSIGIDRIRALKEEVAKAVVEGPRRVLVISDADQMTEPAAQSALKLIEEPPPETTLILTAGDSARLLPTLVSRCQRLSVRPIPTGRIAEILRGLGASDAEAELLAELSRGSLGRALEMKDENVLVLWEKLPDLFRVGEGEVLTASEVERRVRSLERNWNADAARLSSELLLVWHHRLLHRTVAVGESPAGRGKEPELSVEEIRRRVRILEDMAADADSNVNPVLSLSSALQQFGSAGDDSWTR